MAGESKGCRKVTERWRDIIKRAKNNISRVNPSVCIEAGVIIASIAAVVILLLPGGNNYATIDGGPSDIIESMAPLIPDNEILSVSSPDGTCRAEAFGTNKSITAAGRYPYEGMRVIRNSDEKILWSDVGYYGAEFLWSGDSRYVAVYREARTYGECLIVEAATGSEIKLPGLQAISARHNGEEQPDEDRPDSYFKAMEWQDDRTIKISYSWNTQKGETVTGTFTFNIESGDIVTGTSGQ